MVWLLIGTLTLMAILYVRVRRQRKAKQTTYVPN